MGLQDFYTRIGNFFTGFALPCRKVPLYYGDEKSLVFTSSKGEGVLILPPSDYWVLSTTLSVKTEKEAVKFAPALFELNGDYRYAAVKKKENHFVLIAYSPSEIWAKLVDLSWSSSIQRFTFAQYAFADGPFPIVLKNGKYLTLVDDVIIELDPIYIQSQGAIPISELLEKTSCGFKTYPFDWLSSTKITPATLKISFLILLIVFVNLLVHGMLLHQKNTDLDAAIKNTLNEYTLPETSMERDAIMASLQKKEKKQLQLRHQLKLISDIPLEVHSKPFTLPPLPPPMSLDGVVLIPGSKPGESNRLLVEGYPSSFSKHAEGIQELYYDGKGIKAVLHADTPQAAEKWKSEIMKRFKKGIISGNNNQFEVRLK